MEILNEHYIGKLPAHQNALDIFRGSWTSKFPEPFADLKAGPLNLFVDPRVEWFASQVGGVEGKCLVELGPLEGGHAYMLDRMGAASIVAIEANTVSFLKCLVAKEVLGMKNAHFLCGDFIEYLRASDVPQFDVGIASGVLYHMATPAELIDLLSRACKDHLYLWTHYFDDGWMRRNHLQAKFPSSHSSDYRGFKHTLVRQEYRDSLTSDRFCGGTRPFSHWMPREDVLACLRHFGFGKVKIAFDNRDHPHGPSFSICASR